MSRSNAQYNPIRARVTVIGIAAAALVILYTYATAFSDYAPRATVGSASSAVHSGAVALLGVVNVTVILVCVAALAAIALIRQLHYGIGAVLACVIGSTITGHVLAVVAAGSAPADLPSGSIIAVTSCVAAALMVTAASVRPIVMVLGASASALVSAAAWTTGSASALGMCGALLVTALWWSGASIAMLYSPVAAAREAQNPLDTAALALHKRLHLPVD